MKNALTIGLLLFSVAATAAEKTCLDHYSDAFSHYSHSDGALPLLGGTAGVAAGLAIMTPVIAVGVAATPALMIVPIGMAIGGVLGAHRLQVIPYERVFDLIEDADVYIAEIDAGRADTEPGKWLKKAHKRINKTRPMSMIDLARHIFQGNRDGSLCAYGEKIVGFRKLVNVIKE